MLMYLQETSESKLALTVILLTILQWSPSAPEAPKFVRQLESKEIFETMPVKLVCQGDWLA